VLRRLAAETSFSVVSSPARVLRPKQVNTNASPAAMDGLKRKKRKSCDAVPSKMIKRY
jgi:hypothetical protein